MTNPFTGIIFMQFLWKDLTILEFLALIYKFKKKLVKFHINTCIQVMTYTGFGWIRIQIVKKKKKKKKNSMLIWEKKQLQKILIFYPGMQYIISYIWA